MNPARKARSFSTLVVVFDLLKRTNISNGTANKFSWPVTDSPGRRVVEGSRKQTKTHPEMLKQKWKMGEAAAALISMQRTLPTGGRGAGTVPSVGGLKADRFKFVLTGKVRAKQKLLNTGDEG